MSVKRDHGTLVWVCDNCGEEYDTFSHDFDEAREIMKDEGWKSIKDKDEKWQNVCVVCIPTTGRYANNRYGRSE